MKFEYMYMDEVCAEVEFTKDTVSVKNYTDIMVHRPFGYVENVTMADLEDFFEDRCVPRTRYNIREILSEKLYGYEPILIVKDTHGVMADDCFWIRFEGEDLKWDDVNPRKGEHIE